MLGKPEHKWEDIIIIQFLKNVRRVAHGVSVGRLMCKCDEFSDFLTFRKSLESSTIPLQQNAQEN
jgi:hypothetical protein